MKKGLIAAICSMMIFSFGTTAFAVDLSASMQATVIKQIVLSQTTAISFGQIYDTAAATCAMDPSDGSLTGTACAAASGTAGSIHIVGSASTSVDYSVTSGAAVEGMTFVPDFDGAGTATGTATLNASGTGDVSVGGTITIGGSSPTEGVKNFTYTFSCTY